MIRSGADADFGGINRIRYTVVGRPTVPVVWLDTFAVANFAAAIDGKGQEAAVQALHYRRLVELVRAHELVSLETDQLVELRDKPSSLDASVRVLARLASRFDATRRGIEDCQERVAMRAYLADSNAAELPWSEAIAAATTESDAPFVVRATVPDDDAIAARRERKQIVKDQWSDIQQDVPAMQSEAGRFENQLGQERFGMQQAFDHWLYLVTDADEADGEQLLNALHAIRTRRRRWTSCGGPDDIMVVREFYGSPHYLALPYVQIGTELRALLLAKPHRLKASDNMDVFNIAAVLPYADFMIIDGAMIENATKRRLAERFGCQTKRLTQIGEFLDAAESGSWRRVEPLPS